MKIVSHRVILKILILIQINIKIILTQNNLEEYLLENVKILDSVISIEKKYQKITMAYITPWNKNGYDLAIKYANKIDIISPVWFIFKPETINNKISISIEGSDNVNEDFLDEIRKKNKLIKIVPRFICETFNLEKLKDFTDDNNLSNILKVFIRRLKYNKFDGMAFECHDLIHNINKFNPNFMKSFYNILKKDKFLLINTIFPFSELTVKKEFNKYFKIIADSSDYVNIMTYDFFNHYQKQNIAPMSWINQTFDFYLPQEKNYFEKILLGIPFHGAQFIDKKEINLLTRKTMNEILYDKTKKIDVIWDENEREHSLRYREKNKECNLFFPSRKFIRSRLDFSIEKKIGGISIWDIAQGFEGFMEEF